MHNIKPYVRKIYNTALNMQQKTLHKKKYDTTNLVEFSRIFASILKNGSERLRTFANMPLWTIPLIAYTPRALLRQAAFPAGRV